ncbi:MAG: hypothetical protein MR867_08095 [Eubacterium sp.]|nr:hypothetical protein [Eubacterium sp.]MDD7208997.1 histidine kinase N-terminal 7TM domain-containing protein [Lachnospiraceae bacterium]MDY5497419.1 histidine kinase N-terminal 7TM domain-containing protein [Anaerobutyricum sp.]
MENSQKTKRINFICLCPVVLAMLVRALGQKTNIFSHNVLICAFFSAASVLWMLQIQRRVVHKKEKIFLTLIVVMIQILIILRTVKYNLCVAGSPEARWVWYLYYIPQTFIVLFMFFTVLYIGKPSDVPISRLWNLLYIPAGGICIGIITNDFHQMAFRFPEGISLYSDYYSHGPLYFLSVFWIIFLSISILGIVFHRCAVPQNRKKIILPSLVLFCGGIYWIIFFMNPDNLFLELLKVPEMLCLLFAAFMESLIIAHLIPSNDGYEKFVDVLSLGMGIMDQDGKICFRSKTAQNVTPRQICVAKTEAVFPGENLLLQSCPIYGGMVYWVKDLSKINRLNEELSQIAQILSEENELLDAKNQLMEKKILLEQKNKLYETIAKNMKPKLLKIENRIMIPQADEDIFEVNLKYACVLQAYIKRHSNLQILLFQQKYQGSEELWISILESVTYVRLYGIPVSCSKEGNQIALGREILLLYEIFEEILEMSLSKADAILVHMVTSEKKLELRFELGIREILGEFKQLPEKWKKDFVTIQSKREDETEYISICYDVGGENI